MTFVRRLGKTCAVTAVLLALWQLATLAAPPYILPPPAAVFARIYSARAQLLTHAAITLGEIGLGLLIGTALGSLTALALQYSRLLRELLAPLLVSSQAIPVYALAPLLTLWFGFGILPKILMTVLIIYFPITTAAYDGLRRTPPGYLDLAHSMGANAWRTLIHIRLPAALPSFASGLRVAVAIAPIGAVIGEWVGGSKGLGYLMTYANARSQSALLFAALTVLVIITLGLYTATDRFLNRLIRWQPVS
ncbi:ABC transporter permease [uncultured Cardiobacterium sp.]|uniref:ABC transporter permease n=1 Tax=uncultured Cardiobacterium sp. TaxID=417619 RepID=UPI002611D559|nr:ABC transporter permease [uncultured Cardiobacterium sp.]